MKGSWIGKLAVIGIFCLALLVPMVRITFLVAERQARHERAADEIHAAWGGPQTVGGPLLTVPCRPPRPGGGEGAAGGGRSCAGGEVLYLLPHDLAIDAEVTPYPRHRGLFETVVYRARVTLRGGFRAPDFAPLGLDPADLDWEHAALGFGLSDLKGLAAPPELRFAGEAHEVEAVAAGSLLPHAAAAHGVDTGALAGGEEVAFELSLELNGSRTLHFLPLGRETRATIVSTWPDPSFQGAFLPAERELGPEGFRARWSVSSIARGYPQAWRAFEPLSDERRRSPVLRSAFGLELLRPVAFYQLVSRCTKYAALFLVLTFAVFFLFEALVGLRIHPIQYLMVGAALCLFYLLLLAIAEHAGFGPAYLAAASATIALISSYSATVLRTHGRAAVLAFALTILYAVLYVLVQLQTYALLVGSIALFVALAIAMYLTRDLDWYELGRRPEAETLG